MGTLDGKVALVTGAGRGVGRGIAIALAKEGAAIAIPDIDGETAADTAAEVVALGARSLARACDVRSSAEVDAFVAETVEALGTVDILVNNAIATRAGMSLQDTDDETIELSLASGPKATFYCMRACYPHLVGDGRVINLRSGSEVQGMKGYAAYIAAKAAVGGITRAAAREWGRDGITVNGIAPFALSPAAQDHFDEHPQELANALRSLSIRRSGDPETDVGRAVVFLAGPDASFITGCTIAVDGGGVFFG